MSKINYKIGLRSWKKLQFKKLFLFMPWCSVPVSEIELILKTKTQSLIITYWVYKQCCFSQHQNTTSNRRISAYWETTTKPYKTLNISLLMTFRQGGDITYSPKVKQSEAELCHALFSFSKDHNSVECLVGNHEQIQLFKLISLEQVYQITLIKSSWSSWSNHVEKSRY